MAKTTQLPVQKNKIDSAIEVLKEKTLREEKCNAIITAALKQYNCTLVPSVTITGTAITHNGVSVVALDNRRG